MSDNILFFLLGVLGCIALFTIASEIHALRLQLALLAKERADSNERPNQ